MPRVLGVKSAVWNLVERMCPSYQATSEALRRLEAYEERHERLKAEALKELARLLAREGARLVAHSGVDTDEARVEVEVDSTTLKGRPDIVAVFHAKKHAVVASVEVKSTQQAALESASTHQSILYAYILYAARFPEAIKESRAEASREITRPRHSCCSRIHFQVEADMYVVDHTGLAEVAERLKVERIYQGFLAYHYGNSIRILPVFTAGKDSMTAAEGLEDPLEDIIIPAIQDAIEGVREERYVPGPWCTWCALRSSCPAFTHKAPGVSQHGSL